MGLPGHVLKCLSFPTPTGVRYPDDFQKERPLHISRLRPGLIAALALFTLLLSAPALSAPTAENPSADSAAQLADLLENGKTRQALIEQLRRSAQDSGLTPETTQPDRPALPQRVANVTRTVAERTVADASAAAAALRSTGERLGRSDNAALARDA